MYKRDGLAVVNNTLAYFYALILLRHRDNETICSFESRFEAALSDLSWQGDTARIP